MALYLKIETHKKICLEWCLFTINLASWNASPGLNLFPYARMCISESHGVFSVRGHSVSVYMLNAN